MMVLQLCSGNGPREITSNGGSPLTVSSSTNRTQGFEITNMSFIHYFSNISFFCFCRINQYCPVVSRSRIMFAKVSLGGFDIYYLDESVLSCGL